MNNIRQYSSPHMPAMLLVGNKIDLPNRVVSFEDGQAAANQYNCRFIGADDVKSTACCCCDVSSLTGVSCDAALQKRVRRHRKTRTARWRRSRGTRF